ncbi:HAMP domain-containing protein, partial [Thioalkalivibrio sp. ALE11]|uniref:HAMP domain-containing protein n=1 Tax=Thioalkalivibrio sp. ALE11 TaxID=1265494 RepID=UPI0003806587
MAAEDNADGITISADEYNELIRMRWAVDTATQPFMMIRSDWTINYLNEPMKRLLQERAGDIRAAGGTPTASTGEKLDRVFPQLLPERSVMDRCRHEGIDREYTMGEAILKVHVTGEDSEEGEFLGNTLEWFDLTAQRDAESQIEKLIREVLEGRLDERIDTEELDGFVRQLGDELNRLIDSVKEPVDEAIEAVQALAQGDLTVRMEGDYKGEFGRMQEAINGSMDHLDDLVRQILEGANNVRSASSEIAQGNTDLSQRTEEQASSLEETASSMEEMTSTVKSNADNS